ncbi:unnamed protein product [Nippostrongylus brasiliensis]|uniref:L-serine ammonia-lyase n=1 Tax=Nippostrongylus brasiliensis TaxID=27835 RepID=A0A158QZX3_NIPBR|nr:unnamed protein product [Nippostrongylus brasiliensis]
MSSYCLSGCDDEGRLGRRRTLVAQFCVFSAAVGSYDIVLAERANRGKESLLYGTPPSNVGIFQTAITSVFKITDEYRTSKPDTRYQIRMSAVQYSQRENHLTDLLSPFNSDPRRRAVRVVDDPRAGALLENESEIRVDSPDLALFYLNTVADHRLIEDEETYRTSHVFVFLSVYAYRTGTNELEGIPDRFTYAERWLIGGRRRLAIVDLGLGERNSHRGELTMPAIGSILLALVQGQKYLPARENCLSQLLKCAMCPSRLTSFICSFAEKTDDNENVVQLASKLSRAKRNTRKNKLFSDSSSSHSSGVPRSEIESGSEVSGAETVIFLGPSPRGIHRSTSIYPPSSPSISSKLTQTSGSSARTCTGSIPPMLKGHTPFLSPQLRLYDDLCSPPGTSGDGSTMAHDLNVFGGYCSQNRNDFGVTIASPKRSKSCNLDDEKRQAIMQWVDTCEPLLAPEDEDVNGDRPREILSYPLEDIIEQDEESMKDSIRSKHETDSHPLSILSREDIEKIMSTEGTPQKDVSLTVTVTSTATATPSEMDLYRRASHLEHYASQKLKEIDDEKMKKKRSKLILNCCQNSMLSSGSTVVDWNAIESRRVAEKEKEELERRKNDLRKRREELKIEADEIRREKEQIDKELNGRSLPSVIARQITQQLQGLTLGSKPSLKNRAPSDSLPTTPTIHKKQLAPPVRTPSLTNCAAPTLPSPSHQAKNGVIKAQWVDGMHVRRSSKSRTDRRERKVSEEGRKEKTSIPSPYSKVTDPRLVDGPPSSGRGSDDAASQYREKKQDARRFCTVWMKYLSFQICGKIRGLTNGKLSTRALLCCHELLSFLLKEIDHYCDPFNPKSLNYEHIHLARKNIDGAVVRTPCWHSQFLSRAAGCDVYLKMENLQHTGSFKDRGARNMLMCLTADEQGIDGLVAVKEPYIGAAVTAMLAEERIVLEGAGALGPAAILARSFQGLRGKRVVCILTGGNIDSTVIGRTAEKEPYDENLNQDYAFQLNCHYFTA